MSICAAHMDVSSAGTEEPMSFEKGIWPVFTEGVNREHAVSKLVEVRGYGTRLCSNFSVRTVQSWPEPRAPLMVTAFRSKPVLRQSGQTIIPIKSLGGYL